MKKKQSLLSTVFLICFILLLITSPQTSLCQDRSVDLESLKYVRISDSVVMLHNPKAYGSNMTCVALKDGLVFIDCTLFTEIAGRFRKDMEEKFHKKALALLLTHVHIDHFFGMDAFSDVDVMAAETGKELFNRQLTIDFKTRIEGYEQVFPKFGKALESAKPFLPTKWFGKEISLGSGSKKLVIRNTGGHSSCSSYAYLPSESVVIAGDLVQADQHAYFGDPTTDMDAWIETLKKWEKMSVTKVCSGHGSEVDLAYLVRIRKFFEELMAALKKLKKEGVPVEEAVRHASLPRGYWPEDFVKPRWYDYAVASIYRGL